MNQNLAKIFHEIAEYLEMEETSFKSRAYRKAAIVLESLEQDIEKIYQQQGLKGLELVPGIGKSIAQKIEEYLKTGQIKYHQQFKKAFPFNLEELTSVQGLGPRKAKKLYQELAVVDLKTLEKAIKSHKVAQLDGFNQKTEENIKQAISFLKKDQTRFLLGDIFPLIKDVFDSLKNLKQVNQISLAGSVRRMKETVNDVDVLITTKNPEKIMDFFVQMSVVEKVWMKGLTKSSVRTKQGFDIDLRVVKNKSYGSALQYFTGSKEHNIVLRKIAINKKMKLSEYGLFKGKKMIAGWTEKGVYNNLGLDWIEPELRENQGEIEAGLEKTGLIPKIINYQDVKGDLHCHSSWSGGENTIEEMAKAALLMNYQYIGITDHTKFLRIEHGLDEQQLASQRKEILKLNSRFKLENLKIHILQGCEANILNNGSVDIKDQALKKLDYVIAGIHSSFKMSEQEMTERMIKAIKNPNINIISHPLGRILKKRQEYQIDFNKVLRAAKQYKTILEINAYPQRLDLNDRNIRQAKQNNVKMVINSDAHHKNHLQFIRFGIGQARRGWAEKNDIINVNSLEKLLKFFNKNVV
jgi:DNA polymerase (family X)